MAFGNTAVVVGAFLLLGTPWWYMVGRIGLDSHERRRSFLTSFGGAAIALFTCFVSTVMTFSQVKNDISHESAAIVQYALVALLCLVALLSTLSALLAAVTSKGKS